MSSVSLRNSNKAVLVWPTSCMTHWTTIKDLSSQLPGFGSPNNQTKPLEIRSQSSRINHEAVVLKTRSHLVEAPESGDDLLAPPLCASEEMKTITRARRTGRGEAAPCCTVHTASVIFTMDLFFLLAATRQTMRALLERSGRGAPSQCPNNEQIYLHLPQQTDLDGFSGRQVWRLPL